MKPNKQSSTDLLVKDLLELNAPSEIISKAKSNQYHDYKSDSATPIFDLVNDCIKAGLSEIAEKAKQGVYNATKEESDEWVKSEDGQGAINSLRN